MGSEMCIRDRNTPFKNGASPKYDSNTNAVVTTSRHRQGSATEGEEGVFPALSFCARPLLAPIDGLECTDSASRMVKVSSFANILQRVVGLPFPFPHSTLAFLFSRLPFSTLLTCKTHRRTPVASNAT